MIAPFASITFDCTDPPALAEFYRRLVGGTIDASGPDWVSRALPAGRALHFSGPPATSRRGGPTRTTAAAAPQTPGFRPGRRADLCHERGRWAARRPGKGGGVRRSCRSPVLFVPMTPHQPRKRPSRRGLSNVAGASGVLESAPQPRSSDFKAGAPAAVRRHRRAVTASHIIERGTGFRFSHAQSLLP